MKEFPILFTGEMVRAILDGRKTQTRRPVKPQPFEDPEWGLSWAPRGIANNKPIYCERNVNFNPITKAMLEFGAPLGTVGDRLWVRETFGFSRQCDDVNEQERVLVYKACEPFHVTDAGVDRLKRCNSGCLMQPNHYVGTPSRWTPSIHMPRWASRIDLEIIAVRVERVQDISDDDAESEGVDLRKLCGCQDGCATCDDRPPKEVFRDLWQSIYGTWDGNPWVWVYEFRRIKP